MEELTRSLNDLGQHCHVLGYGLFAIAGVILIGLYLKARANALRD